MSMLFEQYPGDDQLDDSTIEAILDQESRFSSVDVMPDTEQYFAGRKRLIGPVADISHPEFGRPNRPEETYAIFYSVKDTVEVIVPQDNDQRPTQKVSQVVKEYIFDNKNNLVASE